MYEELRYIKSWFKIENIFPKNINQMNNKYLSSSKIIKKNLKDIKEKNDEF